MEKGLLCPYSLYKQTNKSSGLLIFFLFSNLFLFMTCLNYPCYSPALMKREHLFSLTVALPSLLFTHPAPNCSGGITTGMLTSEQKLLETMQVGEV